jgi:prepilin-type N-terminal cleavage/methylation domain-containing protein
MKGFTLIEVLVVMGITVIMTGLLMQNFSRLRTDLGQERLSVQNAIREAQSLALSGVQYNNAYRCGYGIHFDATSYTVYAGPDAQSTDCTTLNRKHDSGLAVDVRTGFISSNVVEIAPVGDIFFEPPNPTTYLCDATTCASTPGASSVVRVQRKGATCSGTTPTADCRSITVSSSGSITPN